ncbi:MAG: hypothetical protein Q7T69_02720 [Rhodoferax sp.]|nr:hypothetical protein [Rhodoferax sp.]
MESILGWSARNLNQALAIPGVGKALRWCRKKPYRRWCLVGQDAMRICEIKYLSNGLIGTSLPSLKPKRFKSAINVRADLLEG